MLNSKSRHEFHRKWSLGSQSSFVNCVHRALCIVSFTISYLIPFVTPVSVATKPLFCIANCILLGVRSLANASRARQFNPLNPPGVGWVPLPQTNMAAVVGRARSCVVGHAWSVVCGRARSCVLGRSYVVVHGRAWSCVAVRGRARSVVHGRSCAVVRGRARSCVVVRGRAWSVVRDLARSCAVVRAWSVICGRAWSCVVVRGRAVVPFCPLRGQHCRGTNERTTSNNPLNLPGVGWVNLFYFFKVRVSIRTCVPNLGSFRRSYRKFCL